MNNKYENNPIYPITNYIRNVYYCVCCKCIDEMNLKNKTTVELYNLSKAVRLELNKRSIEYKALMLENSKHKQDLFAYAKRLVSFIESELKIRIVSKSRKREFVTIRFVVMEYLHLNNMSLKQIGKVFNRDHSTVIVALNRAEWLLKNKDTIYIISYEKINALITEFNKKDSNSLK